MGASICCAEAEADTQFTIFDLSALKKQCLDFLSLKGHMLPGEWTVCEGAHEALVSPDEWEAAQALFR
jgi:hypothetical protein